MLRNTILGKIDVFLFAFVKITVRLAQNKILSSNTQNKKEEEKSMSRKMMLLFAAAFSVSCGIFAQEAAEEVVVAEEAAPAEPAITSADAKEEPVAEKAEEAQTEVKAEPVAPIPVPAAEEVKKEEVVIGAEEAAPAPAAEPTLAPADAKEEEPVVEKPEEPKQPEVKAEAAKTDVPTQGLCGESCFLPAGRTLLLWLPNRLLDVSDVFSVELGVGSEFSLEVDVTKCLGFGGSFGDKYFIHKGYARQYGGGYTSGWNYQNLCLLTEKRYVEDTFGTTKGYFLPRKPLGLPDYDFTYKEDIRDFWAVGVKAGWLFSIDFQAHPLEIADLVAGIFFIDCLGKDDIK
jgi:hypothetical protein